MGRENRGTVGSDWVAVGAEVREALAAGRGVVALESTIIAHGLPYPENLGVARRLEAAVRASGAVPAMVAVAAGRVQVGVTEEVLEQLAVPGQRLEAGSPVAQIARAGRLAIELQASREQAQGLRAGDALQVDGCKTPARITALSPQLSSATQGVQLRAELTGREDCLRINQFVQLRAQAPAGGAAVFSLPAAAVVQQGGRHYVFVRTAQGFKAAPVSLGTGGGSELSITAGLQAGDEVAVKGVAAIKGAWLGLGAEGQ